MPDTFILRDRSDGNGYVAFVKLSSGADFYGHSMLIKGPISQPAHYLICNVSESGIILEDRDVAHSRKEAFDKAYQLLREYHKDCTIIDETSRAKESQLSQDVRENTAPPFPQLERKSGPYPSGPPKVY